MFILLNSLSSVKKHLNGASIPKSVISIRIKVFGNGWSDLSGLAYGFRSSREVDRVDLWVYLSKASYAAAEKAERRMALKIWTERSHSLRP